MKGSKVGIITKRLSAYSRPRGSIAMLSRVTGISDKTLYLHRDNDRSEDFGGRYYVSYARGDRSKVIDYYQIPPRQINYYSM